jgi:lysophospholipase L1-like esterase
MNPCVYAIGDSVMQGAGPDLYATLPAELPDIEVDAVPYRQLKHAPALVRARLDVQPRPDVLVIHLGTNGPFTDATFDELLDTASDVPTIIVLTIKAPRDWETAVNERLISGVHRHPQRSTLLDWSTIATRDDLHKDGFHLTATGATAYAEAIANTIHRRTRTAISQSIDRIVGGRQ